MVHKIEDDLFEEFEQILNKDLADTSRPASHHDALLDIFTCLDANREITRALIGPHGDLSFVNRLKNLVKEQLTRIISAAEPTQDYEYIHAFVVSGCIGIFETWLQMNHPLPPESMADLCSRLIALEPLNSG